MLNVLKSSLLRRGTPFLLRKVQPNNYFIRRTFCSGEPPKQDNPTSKYKEAFEDLKNKINAQQPKEDDKLNKGDAFDQMKDQMYRDFKYDKEPIDSAKQDEAEVAKKAQEEANAKIEKEKAQQAAQASKQGATDKAQTQQEENKVDPTKSQTADQAAQTPSEAAKQAEAEAKGGIKEKITEKAPFLGKVVDFVADSWEQTFPGETYHLKAQLARKKAQEQIEKETVKKEYTEDELGQIQENIPDWKRTAMEKYVEDTEASTGIKDKVAEAIKEKFNQTEVARKLYSSEQYKEYESFRKEMGQFQEDLKDHLSQSQNPAVIASMAVYNKATSESNTAMAIREMRKYIKNFDVFDLERDARGIFCDVYNSYLTGDLTYIEKTCMDAALAYFKTMLKKREVEGVHPKYTHLWESEPAEFVGGRISERNVPCFTYSIRIQEIHCNLSNKTGKVVDGAGDRLLQNRYNFVLSLHETPEVHTVGHMWAIVEIIPLEAVPLLA